MQVQFAPKTPIFYGVTMLTLTEFLSRKLKHLFKIYDVDGNGYITYQDIEAHVARVVKRHKWAGTGKDVQFKDAMIAQWRGWIQKCGTKLGYVSFLEFMGIQSVLMMRAIAGEAEAIAELKQIATGWFFLVVGSLEGHLTVEHYLAMLEGDGMYFQDFVFVFNRFDQHGVGYLTLEQVVDIHLRFWTSQDETDVACWLMGRFM